MSTVNFSVPEEIKRAFNRTFKGRNKSAVIAELMRRAVMEEETQAELRARRKEAFRILTAERQGRPPLTDEEFRRIREEERD